MISLNVWTISASHPPIGWKDFQVIVQGGVIGGVSHESVQAASKRFVSSAQQFTDKMNAATAYPLPAVGKVRFYLLSPQGVLTSEADEQDLGEERNELSPLFYAGQDVITELRTVSEQRSK
ncbi:MAG: hypothetical protein CVU38_06310 [Chloroflexi bacterium HGW-Chloroflexi-1]|nr:MAG: hypothetical protein CVU38_06310 [Chloroflexi bacterium HGW-Chloroflexi-1]